MLITSPSHKYDLQFTEVLHDKDECRWIELGRFHVARLLETTVSLEVVLIGNKWRATAAVLRRDVLADGYALEENEAVIVDVWDLSERLLLHVRGSLLLSLHKVDADQLVGNVLLFERNQDTLSAGSPSVAVQLQNHG